MWNGPGHGPRGGPPFRGNHRGERFAGRDRFGPDFRGRDEMNMGPMGPMGPRRMDGPPMDMRRMGGPPMRGRGMDLGEMQGREGSRDFFRPGEEQDFSYRRHHDIPMRDKPMNPMGFPGPGRDAEDMAAGGRPPWEPDNRFMDTRDRDMHHREAPKYNNPNIDGRRGFPTDRSENFRDMYPRPPIDVGEDRPYNVDLPPRERRTMEIDKRGPPFNPRDRFDSDMDFRNQPGPSGDFKGRDRSPLRFGKNDVPSMDRERPDLRLGRPNLLPEEKDVDKNEMPESDGSSFMDYRSGEELTLAEEWKNRQKDKNPFAGKSMGGIPEPRFPADFGGIGSRELPPHGVREKPPPGFLGKDVGFPPMDRFPTENIPPIAHKGPQEHLPPDVGPLPGHLNREGQRWFGETDPKYVPKPPMCDERPAFQHKTQPPLEIQGPNDNFKGMPLRQGPPRDPHLQQHSFQSSSEQTKDQDYRDIDYRTESGRLFDYKPDDLHPPPPEKLMKDSKPMAPAEFSDVASQDQDYRNAAVKDKVSNLISITGIPKMATTEQILAACEVRDGPPLQGLKIKSVMPGYSYDMAYVEFLNLEDAVHFMESNKGTLEIGTKTVSMRFTQPDECERAVQKLDPGVPHIQEPRLLGPAGPLEELGPNLNGSAPNNVMEPPPPHGPWQRSSDLTPEAWQQQVDQQLQQEMGQSAEPWSNQIPPHNGAQQEEVDFKESKTMILKNVKPTTSVEAILKALDPFAYLDERNVRLVKGKPPVTRCFCFVDMDSHEQVTRLVELLTKPRPLYIDGVRVYAEVAKPLKNPTFRRGFDQPNAPMPGYPPESNIPPPLYLHPPPFMPPPADFTPRIEGDMMGGGVNPSLPLDPGMTQTIGYNEAPAVPPMYQMPPPHIPEEPGAMTSTSDGSQPYAYGSEAPDMSNYLYDSTSGFFYDPETTLYYDPNSRYFYNAQTQEYLYWDATSKTYIPVPGGYSSDSQPVGMTAEDQAILSNPAADAPLEMKKPSAAPEPLPAPVPVPAPVTGPALGPTAAPAPSSSPEPVVAPSPSPDKKEDEDFAKKERDKDGKEEKPKSLAAVKIMKDMERWAKIQNQKKESVRAPSAVLRSGLDDDRRQSKSADAGFAVFERKISGSEELFKKPVTPGKKDDKSKRPMGSLGMLASDYAAGSDEEVEEDKDEAKSSQSSCRPEEKEDKLTDWKKMACLLCRRQFPNKDALVRHQQLSDLHKQNMEIHLKIKRSKKELEALENQEKELNAREATKSPPEQKRRKHHHQPPQHQSSWAGSSREIHKVSERPGLGAEPVQPRKKKEPVVWDHATYKQAVRKAMFARFKELE